MSVASRSSEYASRSVGLVARAVTAVIEDDDGVIARQRRHVVGEVLLRAAETVHEQQARARARDLDRQPDTVARRDPHPPMLARKHPIAPPRAGSPTL